LDSVLPERSVFNAPLSREYLFVILHGHTQRKTELPLIADAGYLAGFFSRPREHRQQKADHYDDDGDNHQHLD